MSEYAHECVRWPLRFRLTADGKLLVANMERGAVDAERPWFKDARTGKPWVVKKASGFKGLVAQADRDGEYDDLKVGKGG